MIKFQQFKNPIVYCVLDNTHTYTSDWTRELVKNISDFTISNTYSKGYDLLQSQDEDVLLETAVHEGYKYAVVFSTGTEFINASNFYNEIEKLSNSNTFIAGHILDRADAYYELHSQCYFINLEDYKKLGCPVIGKQELGSKHRQDVPWRSAENIHDDYTPKWVSGGDDSRVYAHKCHGWNILSLAFEKDLNVLIFNNDIRHNKKHYYPENQQEFIKHVGWAYQRYNYCANEFIHTGHTETINFTNGDFEQCFVPASGLWWTEFVSKTKPVSVVVYDYNQKALDYWKNNLPIISNVTYDFVKIDLLNEIYNFENFNPELPTLINLSNIYAYEGTCFFYSMEQRLHKENQMIIAVKKIFKNAVINFSLRAVTGFVESHLYGDVDPILINKLKKPTWHSKDWLS